MQVADAGRAEKMLEEAFKQFSGSAFDAILIAREFAEEHSLAALDLDTVLYGLLKERKSKAASLLREWGLKEAFLEKLIIEKEQERLRAHPACCHCQQSEKTQSSEKTQAEKSQDEKSQDEKPLLERPLSQRLLRVLFHAGIVKERLASNLLEPEHILYASIEWSELLTAILLEAGIDWRIAKMQVQKELGFTESR